MHKSDSRTVSTVQKGERVKTANFLIQKTVNGARNFFAPRESLVKPKMLLIVCRSKGINR